MKSAFISLIISYFSGYDYILTG